ncbi:uncharacterized protein LOC134178223 [Corticium candelabrum]|uniref:uncharacterized protein LOC134178223 n=1 Tax=Corticium candelabrum TaxID=121492 RepID=UPI002E26ABE6|nr:uncharacterized protein LOC134178223 [Corticium candelabrum]
METLTKNAVQFLDVVRMALSCETSQWDEETLTRAFDWAAYFERVHSRLPCKPHLMQQLDTRMKQISKEMDLALDNQALGFDFLGQAARYVECVLLQNENLERRLYRQLLLKYGQRGCSSSTRRSALVSDVSSIRAEGAKMQFLRAVKDLAVAGVTTRTASDVKSDSRRCTADEDEVEIRLVRESVGRLITHRGPDSSKPDSSKPDSSKPDSSKPDSSKPDSSKPDSNKTDSNKRVTDAITSLVNDAGGVEIVVEALVYRSESELPLVTQQVDKVLALWLVARTDVDVTMWFDLDPDLLRRCVDNVPDVLEAYAKFLVGRAKLCQTQQFHPYKTGEMTGLVGIEKRLVDLSKRSENAKKTCIKLLREAQLVAVQCGKRRNTKVGGVWDKLIRKLEMV